jgi:RecA/RadA recombinase
MALKKIKIGTSKESKEEAPVIKGKDTSIKMEEEQAAPPSIGNEKKTKTTDKKKKNDSLDNNNQVGTSIDSNLFNEISDMFDIDDWDFKNIVYSTGFDIVDALLASDPKEKGFMLRTINGLIGGSGIGKSTFWQQVIGNIMRQKEGSMFFFYDAEKTATINRLKSLGVPVERTLIIKKNTTIENFFALIKAIAKKRHAEMEEHGVDYIMENPYFILADSISAMGTEREIDADSDVNKAMGTAARMWSAMLKIYADVLYRYNITMLYVNQIRDKISIAPGGAGLKKQLVYEKHDETFSGGKALPFYSFTFTRLGASGQLKPDVYGFQAIEVDFNLIKTKNSETNRNVKMVFIPSKGYSNFWSNLFYLKDNGYIKTGAYYRFDSKYDIDKLYSKTWRLKESENKYLTDPEFKKAFDKAVQYACEEIIMANKEADKEFLDNSIAEREINDD